VMRNKLGILLTLASICMMFGCDKLDDRVDGSGDFTGEQHSCEDDHQPHPYLSCVGMDSEDPPEVDPACTIGCGGQYGSGVGYVVCGIPCDDVSDCGSWDPGDSVAACGEGRCYWYCDEEHACPSDLECISRGDLQPGELYSGECMALDD
jgi:hypothetical protein